MLDYFLYFITGGAIVTAVIWLARAGYPFLSGIALVFPSVTLVSFYFVGKSSGWEAVALSAKSTLYATFFVWMPYIITIAYLTPKFGVNKTLAIGTMVFFILAFVWICLNKAILLR